MGSKRDDQLEINENQVAKEVRVGSTAVLDQGSVSTREPVKNTTLQCKIEVLNMESNEDDAENIVGKELVASKEEGSSTQIHMECTSDENNYTCCICRKNFPSSKALYGHMRVHSNRGWKGVRPPPLANNNYSNNLLDSSTLLNQDRSNKAESIERSGFDQSQLIWSRLITAGRTSKTIGVPQDHSVVVEDSFAIAVDNLMMLSGETVRKGTLRKRSKQSGEESDAEDEGLKLRKLAESNMNSISKKQQTSDKEEEETAMDQLISNDKRRKKVAMETLLSGDSTEHYTMDKKSVAGSKFICYTCERSFSTHQALGGHMASHRKNRTEGDDQLGATVPSLKTKETRSEKSHQCKVCYMSFPTGQALGGHQRRHWKGPVNDITNNITAHEGNDMANRGQCLGFDLNEGNDMANHRQCLDFDLNELPDPLDY